MNLYEILKEQEGCEQSGKVYGVVVGLVTDNQDPDKLGKIKVTFPWLSDEEESHWARMATMMAGKERGSFYLPEIDDEVLVIFEHGDVRFPYVIGMLWNGKDTPPYDNADGNNDIRSIKSRSGHEILFNDNESEGKIDITTNSGHKVTLDDTSGSEKVTILDKSNNSIEIDSNQNSIAIKSEMKLSIESQKIDIKSKGMMNIEATGNLTLKGAMIMIN